MAEFKLDPKFLTEVERRQQRGLFAAGEEYLKDMAETLSNDEARHGIEYEFRKASLRKIPKHPRIPRRIRIHRASAPGEAPAMLTGDLRKRRAWRIGRSATDRSIAMQFGSNVPYAGILEKGMNRPAWAPTMEEGMKRYMRRFAEVFGSDLPPVGGR